MLRHLLYKVETLEISLFVSQWRNDGVAAASRDGGPHWQGAPDSSKFLMINF